MLGSTGEALSTPSHINIVFRGFPTFAIKRVSKIPRMRNSLGVPKEGNTQIFSAVTKTHPGPARGPGALPDLGMVCCGTWREGRRTGPFPGCMHARKTRTTNGG